MHRRVPCPHPATGYPTRRTSAATRGTVREPYDLALAKMIAATVRTELRNLFREVCKPAGLHQLIEPRRQRVLRIVVAHMRRVLAMRRPLRRDAERRHIVGVRSTMASINVRRTVLSWSWSSGRSSWRKLIEHLMSTPTGLGYTCVGDVSTQPPQRAGLHESCGL